jgi:hypothetical protein
MTPPITRPSGEPILARSATTRHLGPASGVILKNSAALLSAAESECVTAIHIALRACVP